MSLVDLVMPKLGESIMEATILKWHKNVGDKIAQDETLLDIATDKVDSEVPSTAEGIIEEVLFKENDVVPIGTVIAKIRTGATDNTTPAPAPTTSAPKEEYEEAKVVEHIPYQPSTHQASFSSASDAPRFYSPLVLNIAQSEGISMSELENIPGTGQDGRVSKKDILQYVSTRGNSSQPKYQAPTQQSSSAVTVLTQNREPERDEAQLPAVVGGNVEIIEMDRMRKLI
ncbi:MAG: biotin/lipoyl-containing protein, partial [Ferruginibacter sp.]